MMKANCIGVRYRFRTNRMLIPEIFRFQIRSTSNTLDWLVKLKSDNATSLSNVMPKVYVSHGGRLENRFMIASQ